LLEKGPVVLMFYRGYWCPYCNRQLQQFQDSLQLINELGGTVVAVTPESVESINKTVEKTNVQFRIIHDNQLSIMKAYDVAFTPEEDVLTRYKKKGMDLNQINSDNGENLPVPATYIINQEGKIIYAFFDPDYKKRATVAKILKNL
jgi:peroxiredoxin